MASAAGEPAIEHGRALDSEARSYGLTTADLRHWNSFPPWEISRAIKHGVTPAVARRWARQGIELRDTVDAAMAKVTLEEVLRWTESGFAPADAVEAKEAEISLTTAIAWRAAGFILPDAALLIRDGWTLDAAIRARFANIDRYRPVIEWLG